MSLTSEGAKPLKGVQMRCGSVEGGMCSAALVLNVLFEP